MSDQVRELGWTRDWRHFSPVLRVALFAGLVVHLLGFFIFRVVSNPLPSKDDSPAFLLLVDSNWAGEAPELVEQASLFDSAPLFIPGEWSSHSDVFTFSNDRDWQIFRDFEPPIKLADRVRPERLSFSQVAEVKQPIDLLNLRFWEFFTLFGQNESGVSLLAKGGPVAQVTAITGTEKNSPVLNLPFDIEFQPEKSEVGPVVVFMNMAATGLPIGRPVISQSSGSDVLDAKALNWLKLPATVAKLPGGFLMIRVFPF